MIDKAKVYHDLTFLGCREFSNAYGSINQRVKEPIIRAYTAFALAKCGESATYMELFCADGYYALLARKLGAVKAYAVDNNQHGFSGQVNEIADYLGITNVEFINADIITDPLPVADVVANVGGLYHVGNPKTVLEKSYNLANKYLIIQSVVTTETTSDTYFAAPPPGWTWGSRYSRQSFERMMKETGYKILDSHFNELPMNKEARDRGSVYFLIEKY